MTDAGPSGRRRRPRGSRTCRSARLPAAGRLGPAQLEERVLEIPFERHAPGQWTAIVIAPDRAAPIVAVNLWYDVGRKHEKPGQTGFAHLFEHMMFQGSEHVDKGEHFALVAARRRDAERARTWLDRTNYFETLPSDELELALWLEADRMATCSPAMTQEKLDNQRDVVKNERRWSVDNQPYGTGTRGCRSSCSRAATRTTTRRSARWTTSPPRRSRTSASSSRTYYCPNNAVLTIAGDIEPDARAGAGRAALRPDPCQPEPAAAARPVPAAAAGRRGARGRARPGAAAAHLRRVSHAGLRHRRLPRHRGRRRPARHRPRLAHLRHASSAASGWHRTSSPSRSRSSAGHRSWPSGRPRGPGSAHEDLERALLDQIELLAKDGPSDDELERVRNLHAAADRVEPRAGRRAGGPDQHVHLPLRRPRADQRRGVRYEAVDAATVRDMLAEVTGADNRLVLTYVPAEGPAPEQHRGRGNGLRGGAGMTTINPLRPTPNRAAPVRLPRLHAPAAEQRHAGLARPAPRPEPRQRSPARGCGCRQRGRGARRRRRAHGTAPRHRHAAARRGRVRGGDRAAGDRGQQRVELGLGARRVPGAARACRGGDGAPGRDGPRAPPRPGRVRPASRTSGWPTSSRPAPIPAASPTRCSSARSTPTTCPTAASLRGRPESVEPLTVDDVRTLPGRRLGIRRRRTSSLPAASTSNV